MKKRLYQSLLLAVWLLPLLCSINLATEPDTIWTQGPRAACWFTPDGSRIIVESGKCLDVTDGHIIWNDENAIFENISFSEDSNYFFTRFMEKRRISNGQIVDSNIKWGFTLPAIIDTMNYEGWSEPYAKLPYIQKDSGKTVYFFVDRKIEDWQTGKVLQSITVLCKFDRALDSIVDSTPIIIDGNDSPFFDSKFDIIGYNSRTNTILTKYSKELYYNYFEIYCRQYDASTLDSVSEFKFDSKKYGTISEQKISYMGKYLGFGTYGGESWLSWLVIYDLINNTVYKEWIDKDSSNSGGVSRIAFSRNDSFLVATGGKQTKTKTWNIDSKSLIHEYDANYRGTNSIDVSPDDTKIISTRNSSIALLRARWTPVTSTEEENNDRETIILYPNPASDYIEISASNIILSGAKDFSVRVYDVLGVVVNSGNDTPPAPSQEGVRIDVSHFAPGVYFVRVGDEVRKFIKL